LEEKVGISLTGMGKKEVVGKDPHHQLPRNFGRNVVGNFP